MRNNIDVPVGRGFVGDCQRKDDCLWWENATGASNIKEKPKKCYAVNLWCGCAELLGGEKPLSVKAVVLQHI